MRMTPLVICKFSAIASSESRDSTKSVVFSGSTRSVVTSSCTTGAGLDVGVAAEVDDVVDDTATSVVVVAGDVVVVMAGMTTMVVDVDVVETSGGSVDVVVVSIASPTTKVKTRLAAKLNELPVQVRPNGLSRPYAYIWYVPTFEGAVTVTVNVAVLRSFESVGLPYTPLIRCGLLTR